jgi:hypothetical protein
MLVVADIRHRRVSCPACVISSDLARARHEQPDTLCYRRNLYQSSDQLLHANSDPTASLTVQMTRLIRRSSSECPSKAGSKQNQNFQIASESAFRNFDKSLQAFSGEHEAFAPEVFQSEVGKGFRFDLSATTAERKEIITVKISCNLS